MHFVAQVQKNSAIVEQVVYAIAGAQIIKEPVEGGGKVGGVVFRAGRGQRREGRGQQGCVGRQWCPDRIHKAPSTSYKA